MTEKETHFFSKNEEDLSVKFVRDGYLIIDAEFLEGLHEIREIAASLTAAYLKIKCPQKIADFLNNIHNYMPVDQLNDLRLSLITSMKSLPWLRPTYFKLAKKALEIIVGNELVMQRRINLSIQMPNDSSSLLPTHADVWSGDSPFEVVLWVPLVDCFKTKSMYLMPPTQDQKIQSELSKMKNLSAEDLFDTIKDDISFMDIPFGKVLLFSQTLMHGNRINMEKDTRWSMNCRFKSAFSPFADKKLGEFFLPITLRAATRVAINYKLPQGFNED